ncbi:MAG: hypothetical protein GY754_45745 [bacterium]|nr:hypothetical protein [bacterium]
MIYFSVTFILMGIFLLVYSIVSRKENSESRLVPQEFVEKVPIQKPEKQVRREMPEIKESVRVVKETALHKEEAPGEPEDDVKEVDDIFLDKLDEKEESIDDNNNIAAAAPDRESSGVILFDDSSNVIDYTSESGSIDPSLEEYKKIRRIGRGKFLVENEGINFYVENKLFRFDFHRVKEITSGGNYLALFLEGAGAVKLFVFEKKSTVIEYTENEYGKYIRGMA